MATMTDVHTKVKESNWVTVVVRERKVMFTPKPPHDELIIQFQSPELFDPPCTLLHISRHETVTLDAKAGQSLYQVFEPNKNLKLHVTTEPGTGHGNAKSYNPEPGGPSGPIIVT